VQKPQTPKCGFCRATPKRDVDFRGSSNLAKLQKNVPLVSNIGAAQRTRVVNESHALRTHTNILGVKEVQGERRERKGEKGKEKGKERKERRKERRERKREKGKERKKERKERREKRKERKERRGKGKAEREVRGWGEGRGSVVREERARG
jgi:hypothetical protein